MLKGSYLTFLPRKSLKSFFSILLLCKLGLSCAAPFVVPDDSTKVFNFPVASVQIATVPLAETILSQAVQSLIGKELFTMPIDSPERMAVPVYMNGFMQTVQYAYAQHRPLVISPDHIWLLICQGVSIHINEQYEKLEKQIFKNERPKIKTVRYDTLTTGEASYWDSVIISMADSVREYAQPEIPDLMLPTFSTTGRNEVIAYATTLLESSQKAFSYVAMSGCGIPNITLTGTVADWEKIYKNVERFNKFGLSHWTQNLKPILKQFLDARKGKVDTKFWNSLYKESSFYGVFNISGWVIKLFPYTKEYYIDTIKKEDEANMSFHYVPNTYMDGEDYRMSRFDTKSFPGGYAKVNIEWLNFFEFEQRSMEVYAGFMAIEQNKQTMALSPYITWAVCQKYAAPIEEDFMLLRTASDNIVHEPELWESKLVSHAAVPPIYAPNINHDSAKAMSYLANYLKLQITNALGEKVKSIKKLDIQFIVTWASTVTNIQTSHKNLNANDVERIQLLLINLPHSWQPAQQYNIVDVDKLYKVNYKVHLQIKF